MNSLLIKLSSQQLISNIPATITICFVPILLSNTSNSLKNIGLFFFLVRLLSIVGSLSVPYFTKKHSHLKLCIYSEFVTILLLILSIALIKSNLLLLGIMVISLRGIPSGAINSSRTSWLKEIESTSLNTERIFIYLKVFQQATYFIAGLSLLILNKYQLTLSILILDIISSFISIKILKTIHQHKIIKNREVTTYNFSKLTNPLYLSLITVDFLTSISIGGINTFLYYLGKKTFHSVGGYPIALSLYGLCYLISVRFLIQSHKKKDYSYIYACLTLILTSMLLYSANPYNCIFFFILYPFVMNINHRSWFNYTKKEDATFMLSIRDSLLMFFFALSEIIFSLLHNNTFLIRISATILTFLLIRNVKKKYGTKSSS